MFALLGGCMTVPRNSCELFERVRAATDYDTAYRYSEAETRQAATSFARAPRKQPLTVRWYTLRISRAQIRTCDHLYLIKDLYLQRPATVVGAFYEQRDFYTIQGQLIASRREDVTNQLKASGFYSTSVPLPIPANAPAGTYRIVMQLIAKSANRPEDVLATTSAEFRVLP